jgi:hypothetical protein
MDLVSYMIVNDWTVAEYKSQGDTQNNYINKYQLEAFWYFDINEQKGLLAVQKLFAQLRSTFPPNSNAY